MILCDKCKKNMNIFDESIEKTEWVMKFKTKVKPNVYKRMLELALKQHCVVNIFQVYEMQGKFWVIAFNADPQVWADKFKHQKDAVALCKKMGWKYKIEREERIL